MTEERLSRRGLAAWFAAAFAVSAISAGEAQAQGRGWGPDVLGPPGQRSLPPGQRRRLERRRFR